MKLFRLRPYKLKLLLLRYIVQFRSTENVFMISMAVVIGLLGGFGAIGIQYLIRLFEQLFWGATDFPIEHIHSLPLYIKIGVPAFGGLIVGAMVYYLAREAKGHGVPEVMKAIALENGIIRPRVAIVKLLASSLCIGSGGSVGREGPVIQIGSSIGSTVGQLFRVNSERVKTFVACGAAAGIAAAFNAPVAGALFSLEIILGDFAVAQFSPIVVSSVVATAVSRTFLGDYPAFIVPSYELHSPYELFFYALLGLVAGFVSLLYIKVLYAIEDFFDNLKFPEVLKPMLGGIIIGLMGMVVPQIFGVGYHSITAALHGEMLWSTMLMLVFLKIFATSVSLGSGGSGGVFAPSLFIGTMVGGFFGVLIHTFFPFSAKAGAYALVGMGALVAGSTHAPITAILIIFEMTNDYKIILPLMISCVISVVLTTKLQRESIYTLKLIRQGIDLFKGREVNILRSLHVSEVMRDDPVIIPANTSIPELIELFFNSPHAEFFVVDSQNHLIGRVCLDDVRRILKEEEYLSGLVIAHDLANPSVARIHKEDTLDQVMRIFGRYAVEELPVVEKANPDRIIGVVTYKDVIEAYNRELIKRDLVRETGASIQLVEKAQRITFMDGYALEEIPASMSFAGKTLKELNIRSRYGVNVLMIKRRQEDGKEKQLVPLPDEKIQPGDWFIVMGKEKDLTRFKNA
ncbi:MAG: CBS domain-containing protein [Calditrichaeota bacterium]|nr:MAG: CBS domain-containing protein [Calditrichota bacterium]